jgi:hypothetical protein
VIFTVEAFVATMKIASELTSRRVKHGAKISPNLRVLIKASKHASVSVAFYGWDFRN